ncbi:MAG: protease modulator HflC [Thiotrichaceae bacterium]
MENRITIFLILLSVVIATLAGAVFTVKETELALRLQLGQVIRADFEPGLHFKIPLLDTVRKFDKRIRTLEAPPEQFLTAEKKNLIVDSFVKWRIVDVKNYFTATGGTDAIAGQRLREIIADGLRREFGKRSIQEVVSSERSKIMEIIRQEANDAAVASGTETDKTTEAEKKRSGARQFGVEIIDVRIKRIELPKEVSSSVYSRMDAERERVAKELRSRGEAEAVRTRAIADRESVELVAAAERDAEKIRGEGDAQAASIYAQAYNQHPEFYNLYRSLGAYRKVFTQKRDVLLLEPNSEFFTYFNQMQAVTPAGQ